MDLPSGGSAAGGIAGWNNYDEYGNTANAGADTGVIHYGWLGEEQRATAHSELLLMGVRLYNPQTALFTSTDPVIGGNTNAYTYPADPVNRFDLDGRMNRADMGGRSRGADFGGRGQDPVRSSGKAGKGWGFKFSRIWKKAKSKSGKSDKDRNSGENRSMTQSEAKAKAKAHAKAGGRCRFRGLCKNKDHYHVDYYNKHGQLFHTRHYTWRKRGDYL